jgi:hypothetical protein
VVTGKDSYLSRERSRDGHIRHHTIYLLKVKKDRGGRKKIRLRDQPGLFNYYGTGDRVRHHKGFLLYEKYDKSRDTEIVCVACLTINRIELDVCARCKCPLLK